MNQPPLIFDVGPQQQKKIKDLEAIGKYVLIIITLN